MTVIGVSQETNQRREFFFRAVFGEARGYVCLAWRSKKRKGMDEAFFLYPEELPLLLEKINVLYLGHDIYFSPMVYSIRKRTKENVKVCTCAWADLDTCSPDKLLVQPTLAVESSPNRYQAYWVLEEPIDPEDAEAISRRIAYYHANDGADKSGWDLSQLLRAPFTYNYKEEYGVNTPAVLPIKASRARFREDDFHEYPQAQGYQFLDIPMPDPSDLPDDEPTEIIRRHRRRISPMALQHFADEPMPEEDWSKPLWSLLMALFEADLTREQVFVVAKAAACNKWRRDGKPDKYLWQDVCRAFNKVEANNSILFKQGHQDKDLLRPFEREMVLANPGFVERYIDWARGLGDAAWQYHQAGAFMALSSILSGTVRLPTSYGTIIPNLWFMILADTTLTRKTTAMDIAMDLILEVEPDSVLASDGSIEGLLTSLGTRPGKPSIFLRDEFSGLLEQVTKRDYYAGMPELLTKLYDGKMQKRVLRKETIEVREPVLLLFTGGIRTKITSLLTFEQVSSGFMPRFIFITAESDITKLKPLGPPTQADLGNREEILAELRELQHFYSAPNTIEFKGQMLQATTARKINASLTEDAWARYNELESMMLESGLEAEHPEIMTPTYDRLSKSTLKAAVLLAAARTKADPIVVELQDILHAIYYCQQWRGYAKEVMYSVGKGTSERRLETIFNAIEKRGETTRSVLMQTYHLNARETSEILLTLEERGLITRQKQGRTELLIPLRQARK